MHIVLEIIAKRHMNPDMSFGTTTHRPNTHHFESRTPSDLDAFANLLTEATFTSGVLDATLTVNDKPMKVITDEHFALIDVVPL